MLEYSIGMDFEIGMIYQVCDWLMKLSWEKVWCKWESKPGRMCYTWMVRGPSQSSANHHQRQFRSACRISANLQRVVIKSESCSTATDFICTSTGPTPKDSWAQRARTQSAQDRPRSEGNWSKSWVHHASLVGSNHKRMTWVILRSNGTRLWLEKRWLARSDQSWIGFLFFSSGFWFDSWLLLLVY